MLVVTVSMSILNYVHSLLDKNSTAVGASTNL